MTQQQKIATVFGGTGFIGRQIVRELAKLGVHVKVATRVPERAYFLRPAGTVGQIVPYVCDYSSSASISDAVQGSDYVVNCIGLLHERHKGDFKKAHADIPMMIAQACHEHAVKRFVHISIPNIEADKSQYASTKYEGEKAIFNAFPISVILRPSVVFGSDDNFFNKFAKMSLVMPFLPLVGGGQTKFQPVYVGDVADAVIAALTISSVDQRNPLGQIYELAGPETVTFKEIFDIIARYTGVKRPYVTLPWTVAQVQAMFFNLLPNPLLTPDQVESLKTDYVISENALTLQNLGINPTAMDVILPTYLSRYRAGGRFADRKAA